VLRGMRAGNEDSFDQEMRHLPRTRKHRDFREFHFYDAADVPAGAPLKLFFFTDLVPGENEIVRRRGKDTDYFARVSVAMRLDTRKLFVWSAFHARDLTKHEMVCDALDEYERLREIDPTVRIVGEANGFQVWFLEALLEEAAARGYVPPIEGVVSKGHKVDRITSHDTTVNTGHVRFRRDDPHQRLLIGELKHVRNSTVHDDLADAWEGCMAQARMYRQAVGGDDVAVGEYNPTAMGTPDEQAAGPIRTADRREDAGGRVRRKKRAPRPVPEEGSPRLGTGAQITPEYIYSAIRAAENGETVKLQDLLFRVSFDPRVTPTRPSGSTNCACSRGTSSPTNRTARRPATPRTSTPRSPKKC
jgi:hypothetical protein